MTGGSGVLGGGVLGAATGGGGGAASAASDLLGSAADGLGDISNINISKGSFASKKIDQASLTERKGSRTTDVGIQKESVGRAVVTQVVAAANVNITSAPPEITG